MAHYIVRPESKGWGDRPYSNYGDCRVVGLKWGPEYLRWLPEAKDEEVLIYPGLHRSMGDEVSAWEGVLGALYDLLQVDAGGNLQDGDTFEVEGTRWRFRVAERIHVVPDAVETVQDLIDESNRRFRQREGERLSYEGY